MNTEKPYIVRFVSFEVIDFENANFYSLDIPGELCYEYFVYSSTDISLIIVEELGLQGISWMISNGTEEGEYNFEWTVKAKKINPFRDEAETICLKKRLKMVVYRKGCFQE